MNDPIIMQALTAGIANLIQSFVKTVAKNGLAIMLLVIVAACLACFSYYQRNQFLDILRANKSECEKKIEKLESRLARCEEARTEAEIKRAVLEAMEEARANIKTEHSLTTKK